MSQSLAPTTELEAVNLMLACIGESPVNTLVGATSVDVIVAQQWLHRVSREVQEQGWHFNTDEQYTMARNVDGHVAVPANVLRIDVSAGSMVGKDITQRSGKLYDRTNHTFVLDEDPKVDVVWFLPFEELPEAARNYIAIRAARKFQQRRVSSDQLAAYDEADETDALTKLKQADGDTADPNILTDSVSVYSIIARDHVWNPMV